MVQEPRLLHDCTFFILGSFSTKRLLRRLFGVIARRTAPQLFPNPPLVLGGQGTIWSGKPWFDNE